MIRPFDIVFSVFGLVLFAPILMILIIVCFFETGSPLFKQVRVGKEREAFTLIKLRTMKKGTESKATHLVSNASITRFGKFLRKTKLDELPQLWNVLKGEMSLVGPRPGLYIQKDLTLERLNRGIYKALPGITGLAQIKKIDMSTPKLLAETDQNMLENLTLKSYFIYIFMTMLGNGRGDRVVD